MRHRKLDFLSLISTLTYDTWFERVVQIATAFELMRLFPLMLVNGIEGLGARSPTGNSCCSSATRTTRSADTKPSRIRCSRTSRSRGSSPRAGVRPASFVAAGLLHCRMYADWAQFRRGWKRIFTEAAGRRARRLALWSWRIRWLGVIFPAWMLAAAPLGALLVAHDAGARLDGARAWRLAALLVWIGALARLCALARAPLWIAPLHIVGAWLTARLLGEAARDVLARTPTQWGGREYDLRADKP